MFTTDYFILSALLAICGYVYSNILIETGEILDWWAAFWYNFFDNEKRLIAGKDYHPLYKAFFQCEKCVSGQMSFWTFLVQHFNEYREVSFELILKHILFITLTILIAVFIKLIFKNLEKNV